MDNIEIVKLVIQLLNSIIEGFVGYNLACKYPIFPRIFSGAFLVLLVIGAFLIRNTHSNEDILVFNYAINDGVGPFFGVLYGLFDQFKRRQQKV